MNLEQKLQNLLSKVNLADSQLDYLKERAELIVKMKHLRKEKNISLEELSQLTEIEVKYLKKLENSKILVEVEDIKAIVKILEDINIDKQID